VTSQSMVMLRYPCRGATWRTVQCRKSVF